MKKQYTTYNIQYIVYKLLSCFLFLSSCLSYSQSFQWLQNGGGNNTLTGSYYASKEQVIDMATDSQRNVYVISIITKDGAILNGAAVTTYEANSNDSDFVLVSYSCDGSYRWHKIFGGGGYDFPQGIAIDSQDNVYVVGGFSECDAPTSLYYSVARIGDNNGVDYTSSNTPTACQRTFLAKFNSNGVFQWIHYPYDAIGYLDPLPLSRRNFYIENDVIYWICTMPPGSYENGAFSNTTTSLPFLHYLLKYDTSGTFISATPFDLELSNYTSAELRWYRNPYNGYYYAIHMYNTASITMTAGGNTLSPAPSKIICFNDLGQYQWHSETNGNVLELMGLDFDSNNNVYINGRASTLSSDSFLGWSASSLSGLGSVGFIMKCTPTLSAYNWVTAYNPGATQTPGSSIKYTPTVIYFAGHLNNNPFSWDGQTIAGPGANNSRDPLLARFDSATGTCLGLQRLVGTNGYEDSFTHIEQDVAGDLLLGGYMGLDLTDSNGVQHFTSGGNSDFFVVKYATQACQPLTNESFDNETLKVYPNPAKEQVQVAIKENVSYTIFNLLGTAIQKGNLTPQENFINTINLQSGCYILQLTNRQGNVIQLKMVKE